MPLATPCFRRPPRALVLAIHNPSWRISSLLLSIIPWFVVVSQFLCVCAPSVREYCLDVHHALESLDISVVVIVSEIWSLGLSGLHAQFRMRKTSGENRNWIGEFTLHLLRCYLYWELLLCL